MKTIISILLISVTTIGYSQNEDNVNTIQQQVNLYNNIDNNVVNYSNPPVQINTRNINVPYTTRTQQVRSRGSRGNRGNASNRISQNIQVNNGLNDNVEDNQNKINPVQVNNQKQVPVVVPQVDLNLNISLNVPAINLNLNHVKKEKIKEEKVSPKRLEDFRIKTGNNSSSGSVSHKSKKEKKSFQKKVLKPLKCWMQRTFKHNTRFHLSCECFKF